jgi:hypothetical protein
LIGEGDKLETENKQVLASFLMNKTQEVLDATIYREDYADSLGMNEAHSRSTTCLGGTLSHVPNIQNS